MDIIQKYTQPVKDFTSNLAEGIGGIINDVTGATSSMKAQQKFNAEQAEMTRNFEERLSNTAYQRAVNDMKEAGLNPAMLYAGGGSGASTPTTSAAQSSAKDGGSAIMGLISSIVHSAVSASINETNDITRKNLAKNKNEVWERINDAKNIYRYQAANAYKDHAHFKYLAKNVSIPFSFPIHLP